MAGENEERDGRGMTWAERREEAEADEALRDRIAGQEEDAMAAAKNPGLFFGETNFFGEMDVFHSYTRAEALDDGSLVDATEAAHRRGYRAPVAFSRAAWARFVAVPYAEPASGLEAVTEAELLDAVLVKAIRAVFDAIAKDPSANGRIPVLFGDISEEGGETPSILDLHLGPGDEGEMVFTFMLPGED